jgi:uncharacterized protein
VVNGESGGPPASQDPPGENVPPGWYPDPWRAAALRWWDGNAWTGEVQHTSPVAWGTGQPGPGQPAMPGYPSESEVSSARAAHLLTLLGYLVPFVSILAPLLIWQTTGKESAFVTQHAKESLNFQISMLIYLTVAGLLILVLIGIVLVPALIVLDIVLVIQQSGTATRREASQYPFCIRFIS